MNRMAPFLVSMMVAAIGACVAVPGSSDLAPAETVAPAATAEQTPAITPPTTPPPEPSEVIAEGTDPEIAEALRLRIAYGLRSDLAYVLEVANDPDANNDDYGVPVYPEEFEDTQRRFAESSAIAAKLQAYAADHVDEFGGLYIQESTRTGVVSLWTNDLAKHAAAIRELVGSNARVAFAQVRYAEADLRILQDEISADWRGPWLDAIPAVMQGVGVDIKASQVLVDVSSANPDAVAIIEAHYGLGDRLRVESDGTGAALIPGGLVHGRVVPVKGLEPSSLILHWSSEDPGDCGGGDIGFGMRDNWEFELPCQAGTRTILVKGQGDEDGWLELGRATVIVEAGATVEVTIRLTTEP